MDTLYFCPSMREGGLRRNVMLCGRGLRTTHMHRPITTYFLGAKLRSISISSKYFGTFFIFSLLFRLQIKKQYIDDLNQQYKTGSARSGYRSYRTFSVAFKQRTGQSVKDWIAEQESALQANKD